MLPGSPRSGGPAAPSLTHPANEFTAGFKRIAEALGIETQQELAIMLDIRQSSISDAKRRGVIPGEWGLKLFAKYKLNPRWIYDGLPPVFLGSNGDAASGQSGEIRSFLLKYPEGTLLAHKVTDSSMEPTIRKDSFVGINTRDKTLAEDALFAIHLPLEGLAIRRIMPDSSTGMTLIVADNPAVPRQRLQLAECAASVAGRVVWVMSAA